MNDRNEKYEVVYHQSTKCILDIGLDNGDMILNRACKYGMSRYGDGCSPWIRSGIFLTVPEWTILSYEKTTDEIAEELGIKLSTFICSIVPPMPCAESTLDNFIDFIKEMPDNNFAVFCIRSDIEDWWTVSKLNYAGNKILLASVIGGGCMPIAYPIDELEDMDNIDDAIDHIIVDSLKYIEGEMPPIVIGYFWRPICRGGTGID